MKELLLKIYENIVEYRIALPRMIDSKIEFETKKKYLNCKKLSGENRTIAQNYWGGEIYKLLNSRYINSYNTYNHSFDPRYLPDDFYYSKIDTYYNSAVACESLDDKNLYDLYFRDINQPQTYLRRCNGLYMDKEYNLISSTKISTYLETLQVDSLIIKTTRLSEGGRNIIFWNKNDGVERLVDIMNKHNGDLIAQEIIHQHEQLSRLHPSSINTIRILSLTTDTGSKVLSTIVRMGANGSRVDNSHAGGCFCGVEDSGKLKTYGYNWFTGERYTEHPTTKVKFTQSVVPNFRKCKELVVRLAPRLASFSKLTSWDLSVTKDGEPILIEVNMCYGGIFFHQIANGPVFGVLTKQIVKEVLNKN